MNQELGMKIADYLAMKNAEIATLTDQLAHERMRREAAEAEADLSFNVSQTLSRKLRELQEAASSDHAEADAEAAMKQQLERQGYEQ